MTLIVSFTWLDFPWKYRGIDYAVANNEQPTKAQELPLLVKQVSSYLKSDFEYFLSR